MRLLKAEETVTSLNHALKRILPPEVTHAATRIPPQYSDFEYADEIQCVSEASNSRKSEFLTGRRCARGALKKLGCAPKSILRDSSGVPLWPENYCGVISHARGYCCAIASKTESYRVLGLDLEMTNRLSKAAMQRVVHPAEEEFIKGCQRKASLLFSAKEAFYKMQYPEWRTPANFQDLVLEPVDIESGNLRVRMVGECFPESLREQVAFLRFRFQFFGDFVLTACLLPHI